MSKLSVSRNILTFAALSLPLLGCGGGGGGGGSETTMIRPDTPVYVPVGPSKYQITVPKASALWEQGAKGAGTTIAILDSGIVRDHSEFDDANGNTRISNASVNINYRFVMNGGHSTVLDHFLNHTGNPDYTYNSEILQDNQYDDEAELSYHGSYVASTAAGKDYGVAPEATILAVKINKVNRYDSTDPTKYEEATTTELFIKGLDYAAQNGATVANWSYSTAWGGGYFYYDTSGNSEYDQAKNILQNSDMPLVIAAGNDGKAIGKNHFLLNNSVRLLSMDPDVGGKVLNVVSITDQKTLSYFSNYPGDCSDMPSDVTPDKQCTASEMQQLQNTFIAAPGQGLPLADPENPGDYNLENGTSFAAPVVAGAIAAIKSRWSNLTGEQIVQILKDSADSSFAGYDPKYFGVGVLDLEAALQPLGTPTSASYGQGYTIVQSAMVAPSWLNAKDLGLDRVAFFDKYNRDFTFNISGRVHKIYSGVNSAELMQNALWSAAKANLRFGDEMSLSLTMSPASAGGESAIKRASFTGSDFTLSIANNDGSEMTLGLSDTGGLAQEMLALSQQNLQNTIGWRYNLGDGLKMTAGWGSTEEQVADDQAGGVYQQIGLTKSLSDSLTVGLGMELHNLDNQLANMAGAGALGIGSNNVALNVASASYATKDGGQFFGLFKYGSVNSKADPQSFLSLSGVQMGQMVLGYVSPVKRGMHWGAQAFSQLKPVAGKLHYNIPVGISRDNQVQYRSGSVNIAQGFLPDSLALYVSKVW